MKSITIVMPYYNQPLMLGHQLRAIGAYPGDLREDLHLVLVDDGSQRYPALPEVERAVPNLGSFRLYRTLVDVPWNQEFAVNLGVSETRTTWFVHLDIDHEMPVETLRRLMEDEHDARTAYSFKRKWARSRAQREPHAALFFLTKKLFDYAGGLDERFAGQYLPSDRDFCARVESLPGVHRRVLAQHLLTHDEADGVPDASAIQEQAHIVDADGEARYQEILRERGDGPTLRLTYPWERQL